MTDEQPCQTIDPLPVAETPRGDGPAAELRAELRMARELLAVREARTGQGQPIAPPPSSVTRPRLAALSDSQLRDHINRLERDLADAQRGFEKAEYAPLNGRLDYVEGDDQ